MSRTRRRKIRRKRRKRSTRKRPKRRKRTRHRRRTQKAGKKSIFKQYKKNEKDTIFTDKSNKWYFPRLGKKAVTYTKSMDNILVPWMNEVVDMEDFVANFMDTTGLDGDEIIFLLNAIKRCAKEILYDKIRSNKNFINKSRLQCMGITAVIVAMKVILEYDWSFTENDLKFAKYITDRSCSRQVVKAMEMDMLKTTNWRSCYEVQKRLGRGNIPHGPTLMTAKEAHKDGVVSKIKLAPEQLERHQLRYDIGRKILPEGWGMRRSTTTGKPFFYEKQNRHTQYEHPMLEGNWHQQSPGSEIWEEGGKLDKYEHIPTYFASSPIHSAEN